MNTENFKTSLRMAASYLYIMFTTCFMKIGQECKNLKCGKTQAVH